MTTYTEKEMIMNFILNEEKMRELYLKRLSLGELQGPLTGKPSIDKPWLKYYSDEAIIRDLPELTCYQYLYDCNCLYLKRTALNYFGRKISFSELFLHIEETAKALRQNGLKEGDIITISLPNIPEAVYLFYACSKIGIIANMVDPRTSEEGIKHYIEEVDSKFVIIIDTYFNKVKKLIDDKVIDKVIAVSPAQSLPFGLNLGYKAKSFFDNLKDSNKKIEYNDKVYNWHRFIDEGKKIKFEKKIEYQPKRPLVIEHTGGTTGNPKGVLLSNDNINAVAVQSVLTGIDMKREHTWLDIMPTFIAYGVAQGLHLPLTIGMETILIPQFDANKFDELLLKHRPVHMVGVPSYWGTIINSPKMQKEDLSYMIDPTVGGDAMDIALEQNSNEFLKNHNCRSKIVKGYGMTEVCGGIAGTLPNSNQIGSVGSPFVKSNIGIFDPETNEELGYNQHGEVCMTGPNIMLGYFANEEATNNILKKHKDGKIWVHSGDIGYITEDGNLFIVDRMKRMIIRYDGFKVFPSLIENVINKHEAIEACKVIGVRDLEHSQGKLPKVYFVIKEQYMGKEEIITNELKEICKQQLPEYVQPCDYESIDTMPLTKIGKIDYRFLEKLEEEKVKKLTKF